MSEYLEHVIQDLLVSIEAMPRARLEPRAKKKTSKPTPPGPLVSWSGLHLPPGPAAWTALATGAERGFEPGIPVGG
jgi:hypothetical protein